MAKHSAKREHKRIIRKTRRLLRKWASKWTPYSWEKAIEPMMLSLMGMQDYYENGYNVHSAEVDGMPSRLELCKYITNKWREYLEEEDWRLEEENWNALCNLIKVYLRCIWD